MYIYENIYKDCNEKIHKLDMCIRKSELKTSYRNTTQLASDFSSGGRHHQVKESKMMLRLGNLKREINQYSTDIYVGPTVGTKERQSGERTRRGPRGHGKCTLVKKVQQET